MRFDLPPLIWEGRQRKSGNSFYRFWNDIGNAPRRMAMNVITSPPTMTQPTKPRSEPSCGRGFNSMFGNLTGAGKQMALMSVSGDNQGWKTCVQVYNLAGFSMEFAAARRSSK